MIGYLRGTMLQKKATEAIIDVNGVGYFCKISLLTSEKIGNTGDEVELYIHTLVREDDISLYGFLSEMEKDVFIRIISISGVGPKMALAIQSTFEAGHLIDIVRSAQVFELTKVSGVGKKTAERLILELQDKFKIMSSMLPDAKGGTGQEYADRRLVSEVEEAILALESLGFQRKKGEGVVNKIYSENPELTLEELIKQSLKAIR
jgi:Holliday junction DNA helicase RuvA